MGSRRSWVEIKRSEDYRGSWVALDECRYDARTAEPLDGVVVDADEDLVALCSRMRAGDSKHCAVLFCDGDDTPPSTLPCGPRASSPPPVDRSVAP
jgi:hypothetical protein